MALVWLFGLDTDFFAFKQRAKQPTSGPQLEAKVMDCRSPSQLAKADLPSTSCDSEMFVSFQGVTWRMGSHLVSGP